MGQKNKKDNRFPATSFLAIFNAVSKDIKKDRSLSGGDRILIELTKRWQHEFKSYDVMTCSSGEKLIKNYIENISHIKLQTINTSPQLYNSIFALYLYKTIKGLFNINTYKLTDDTCIFSSSDFLPDVIPAWYAKLKNKNVKWIAAFYFFASSPFSKDFPYKGLRQRIRGILYYYTQKIAYYLIRKNADFIILCNEVDRRIFIKEGYRPERIYPIYGGVDLAEAKSVSPPSKPAYDAIFMARFHPQKGPLESVKAWKEVIKTKPDAKLAMIGNGPLEKQVKEYIKDNNLTNNVTLLGFMDGTEKYKILKSALIFIHSAIYETGGMAAAEGMAAGLPVIAFDHEGFNYCYPRGMIRVSPIGDTKKLARTIVNLLQDEKKYKKIKQDAIDFVQQWDWSNRAKFLLHKFKALT